MLSHSQLFATTIFQGRIKDTGDEGDRHCVLCGRLREFKESRLFVCDMIELARVGTLSYAGIENFLRLKRLPCKHCLEAILGVSLLTSCGLARLLAKVGQE